VPTGFIPQAPAGIALGPHWIVPIPNVLLRVSTNVAPQGHGRRGPAGAWGTKPDGLRRLRPCTPDNCARALQR
jgi:hypothetical protein